MDTLLVSALIVAVVVVALSLVVLRLDRNRLRRERERHDQSRTDRTLNSPRVEQPPSRTALPLDDPRIGIGSTARPSSTLPRQQAPSVVRSGRITFGASDSVHSETHTETPTSPIRFGAELNGVARKCPACTQPTKRGDSVMECKHCHLHFHASPCWEEFTRDRQKPCPQCDSTQFEPLTLT